MTCQEFQDSLDKYLDRPDELGNRELVNAEMDNMDRTVLDAHLADCAGCREYRDTLLELDVRLTQEYSRVEATALFQNRVRASVRSGMLSERKTARLSILPEVFDFIGWTSVVLIALVVIWRTVKVENIWPVSPEPGAAIWLYTSILTLLALIGIGVKVHSDLES